MEWHINHTLRPTQRHVRTQTVHYCTMLYIYSASFCCLEEIYTLLLSSESVYQATVAGLNRFDKKKK